MAKNEPKSRSVFYTPGIGTSTLHRDTFEECSDRMKSLMFAPTPPPRHGRDGMSTKPNPNRNMEDKINRRDGQEQEAQDISTSSTTAILPNEELEDIEASQSPVYRPLSQPLTLTREEAENSMKECIKKAKGPPQKKRSAFRRIWTCGTNGCSSKDLPSSDDSSDEEEDQRKSNSKKKPSFGQVNNGAAPISQ